MAGALTLLAGCVSLGGKAPEQMLTLTPRSAAPAGAMAGGKLADAMLVLDPLADRRLDVTRVAVQASDSNVAYLKDVAWVERPARLMRRLIAETLRAGGKRLVLEGGDGEQGGKVTLSGRLLDMGYDARSQSAVVRIDMLREDASGSVITRRFEAVVPGVSPDGVSVGPALNRAANDVAAQIAEWLG